MTQPFNAEYDWFNTSSNEVIYDTSLSYQNTYTGGVYQQATSVVTEVDQDCYEYETGCYSIYGFEYKPGFDDAVSHLSPSERYERANVCVAVYHVGIE